MSGGGVSVEWQGLPRFNRAVLDRIDDARDAAHSFVAEGLHLIEGKIKVRAGEGGRHARNTPTPASRGGGPAVISGTLRRSITVGPISAKGVAGFEGETGPTVVYGRRVELGYGYPYTAPGAQDATSELAALARRVFRGIGGPG